jgi:hypothetical protein
MRRLGGVRAALCSVSLAAVASGGWPTTPAQAARSCLRGGATTIAADRDVLVVRAPRRPIGDGLGGRSVRRDAIMACWRPTGKRITMHVDVDFDWGRTDTAVRIVDQRFVGTVVMFTGVTGWRTTARVYDVYRGKKLHDSRRLCITRIDGDIGGVDDVVFPSGGGMAFTCNTPGSAGLVLYRSAASVNAEVLEPANTAVWSLAVAYVDPPIDPNAYNTPASEAYLFWSVVVAAPPDADRLVLQAKCASVLHPPEISSGCRTVTAAGAAGDARRAAEPIAGSG